MDGETNWGQATAADIQDPVAEAVGAAEPDPAGALDTLVAAVVPELAGVVASHDDESDELGQLRAALDTTAWHPRYDAQTEELLDRIAVLEAGR